MKISPYVFPGIRRNDLPKFSKTHKRTIISPELVMEMVCNSCGVTVDELVSKSRKFEIKEARHIFCAIMKLELNYSYKSIGEKLNGRDHTTAIHSIRTFRDRCQTEEGYQEHTNLIINKIYSTI
jgi:chromosomal replication initiator protein